MKRVYFCIADANNLKFFEMMKNSLKKWDSETDLILFSDKDVKAANDPSIFYKATPYFAKKLFDAGYTEVCHLDADQIIVGDLKDIWEGDYDVATVWNDPTYPISVWDVLPYYNNGLNVFKNKEFIEHWLRLCYTPHFDRYQFKEQDLLNILCSDYMNYNVRQLDKDKSIYGEFAKPQWAQVTLKDNKLMIPYTDGEKELKVIHFGGGQGSPDKGNYRIRFNDEVVKKIEELIK